MEDEVENTVKRLCAIAIAQRNRRALNNVKIQLREILREHAELLRSMSEDTFDVLVKVWHL